jgi:hypothetical protein
LASAYVWVSGRKRGIVHPKPKKERMKELITHIYVYCTDFCITSANLMGITYEDFCALVFCVLWPLITLGLSLTLIIQLRQRFKNR